VKIRGFKLCGASYRRRTERGKVVWRCAARVEKGKDACPYSPTLDEEWVQDTLGVAICQNGIYDESKIREEVDKIQVFGDYILIFRKDGSQDKRLFQNG
jgi:site-specific DNA recombinase